MKYKISSLFVIFITFLLSCSSSDDSVEDDLIKLKSQKTNEIDVVYKRKLSLKQPFSDTIKEKTLIFFRYNKEEYTKLVKDVGDAARYEFENLFRQFRQQAQSMKSGIRKKDIRYKYSSAQNFVFILAGGDTAIYDRKKSEMIMGQIFFDGKRPPVVIDGILPKRALKDSIQDIFKVSPIEEVLPDTIQKTGGGLDLLTDSVK